MKYELGSKATDKITGFSGILTGYAKYLTGCDQYLVMPSTDDPTKYPEGTWLDENRLIVERNNKKPKIDTDEIKGACGIAPLY